MTRFGAEEFTKAGVGLVRHQTEILLSPYYGPAEKAAAANQVFAHLDTQPTTPFDTGIIVDAVAAALLRTNLDGGRERAALDYIGKHLDELPPARAADAAFIAARHTQYLPWALAMTGAHRETTPEERESRHTLEREKTADWVRQMGRLDPTTWQAKMDEFSGAIMACTHMERVAQNLARPERHDPVPITPAKHLVAA